MLAVTHLDRRGTVLIRFVVGDTVSLSRAPCPHCGRTSERVVGPVVRGGDLVKVKGMLINPGALIAALAGMRELDEFQVVVRRQNEADPYSMDELVVRIACRGPAEKLMQEVAARAAEVTRVSARVEVVEAREIYEPGQTKAKRFVDTRKPVTRT